MNRVAGVVLAVVLGVGRAAAGQGDLRPTVVLVSIDGFRADYLDRYPAPNLQRLAARGVRAPLVPVFPTKTFPNHYAIVTGLYPEHSGIVENTMYDPAFDALFQISDSSAVAATRWWGGEPLWVTAERQGQIAASCFWPGSEAAIGGIRPHYWLHYDVRMPDSLRVRQVLDWLSLPVAARPTFVMLYFSEVDHAGHESGPSSPAVARAVSQVDAAIGQLQGGLEARGLGGAVNLIVVADHGMSPISPDSVVALDDYLSLAAVARVTGGNPDPGLWPQPGMEDSVVRALAGKNPHLSVWRRDSIPERFHYRANSRIPPVVVLAAPGWSVAARRSDIASHPDRYSGGTHGYDDSVAVMRALFVAAGPAFRRGVTVAPFRNIHIYDLVARILGLTPAANDGSPDSTATLLRDTRTPQ
ncbi:MAG TPA: ectonucleotide pyrophosphatase/phosphodiesterase [Gemmatimonadales bacterium]|nr:ectonucleotide pyrophosphatase/phosphodiesterase [Gemmatimonadales bacterium]